MLQRLRLHAPLPATTPTITNRWLTDSFAAHLLFCFTTSIDASTFSLSAVALPVVHLLRTGYLICSPDFKMLYRQAIGSLLLVLLVGATEQQQHKFRKLSTEQRKQFIITLEEWQNMVMTEAPADFGAYDNPSLTAEEQEKQWEAATMWQWDYNIIDRDNELGDIYHVPPYVVCSTEPGLSGAARFQNVEQLLKDAAVSEDTIIFTSDTLYNADDRTCRTISADTAVFEAAIENIQSPEKIQYLKIQPYLSSMKMIEGTFAGIQKEMDDYNCEATGTCTKGDGSVVVVNSGAVSPGNSRLLQGDSQATKELAIVVILSPSVLYFTREGEVTYDQLIADILGFTKENNGSFVAEASYYESVANTDIGGDVATDRMDFYSAVISNITSLTDPTTGENTCLDSVLTDDITIDRIDGNETISVKVNSVVDANGLNEQQLDECFWFLVHSLTLHPYVRVMELKPVITTYDTSAAMTMTSGLLGALSLIPFAFGLML